MLSRVQGLNSLKRGYIGGYIGSVIGVLKDDARSLGSSAQGFRV